MKETLGFQKPLVRKGKPVRIAIITESGGFLTCSCGGWATRIDRRKVAEDRAEKHLKAKHGGQGIWL